MASQTVTTQLGNIIDPATGNQVGVVPGSVADVGTGGKTFPGLPTLQPLPNLQQIGQAASNAATQAGQVANNAWQKVTNAATNSGTPIADFFGVDLEDVVFVLLGLILIAAALFSFRGEIQAAGKKVASTGKDARDIAAAIAAL